MQRNAYIKDLEAEEDAAKLIEGAQGHATGTRGVTTATVAKGSAPVPIPADNSSGNPIEDARKEEYEALKKEEEEFAKLEALFITELKLSSSELPKYAKHMGIDVAVEEDKSKKHK